MTYFILYLFTGIIAGSLSGLLGIGGGVLVIPFLAMLFNFQHMPQNLIMHMAAGTSLATMIFTASSSLYRHIKCSAEVWPIYKKLIGGVIIGTISGAILAGYLSSNILEILFAVFMLFVSLQMLFKNSTKPTRKLPGTFVIFLVAFLVGFKSGILGIGGGAIIIPFLIYYNTPVRNAMTISIACSLTIAIIGTATLILTGFNEPNLPAFCFGYIYLPAFLGISITSPIFAQIGAKLSHKIPVNILKKIFGGVLLLLAIKMLS